MQHVKRRSHRLIRVLIISAAIIFVAVNCLVMLTNQSIHQYVEPFLTIGASADRFVESIRHTKHEVIDDPANQTMRVILRNYQQTMFVTTSRVYTIRYDATRAIIDVLFEDHHTGL
ncbi:unnamed protein product [Tuwongella immobilis]|uniref:Uncharacterized protein n=1 Tax=Tuwongella immobilis TaxID=692036 RepID=A0A6C2YIZ7_9BACT|nr:unnamed protein product [Tuwongella immobilis]VTR98251.1 unnamed protein product [Tuwongella immobilis]